MAVAKVASDGVVATASQTTLVVPVPAGTLDGHVMLMVVHLTVTAGSITTPAGWTALFANSEAGSNSGSHASLFRRVASSEPANYTITTTSGRSSAAIITLSGVDTTTPEDVDDVAVDASADTAVPAPDVTATAASMLLTFHAGRINTAGVANTWTPHSGMTEEEDRSSAVASVANSSVLIATLQVGSGATGVKTATGTQTLNWIAYSVVVKPSATGGGIIELESGGGDGYLLEDSSGVLVTEDYVASEIVTPTTASLVLTTFAPTVTATNHQLVTPTPAALALTTFAPTVLTPVVVTPGVASLTLTTFEPTINVGVRVTPDPASLVLTTFAPTVLTPVVVTPGAAALILTTFAPTVSTPVTVTPPAATLTLTVFEPTVTVGNNQTVTPTTATLILTTFAPTVTTSAGEVEGTVTLSDAATYMLVETDEATHTLTILDEAYYTVIVSDE